jgi:hypothetical protein
MLCTFSAFATRWYNFFGVMAASSRLPFHLVPHSFSSSLTFFVPFPPSSDVQRMLWLARLHAGS